MKGERDPNAEAEVYITAIIKAELTIADTFTMMGYLKITAAADADGARLEVIGAVTTEISFLGALTGSLNFNVFVGEKTGVVGRVALSLVSTNIPSVELGGILVLELNTFGSTQTVETFKTSKQTIGGREFFGGFVKNNNGEYETENVAIEVTGGFRLLLAGIITIADQFEISGAVEFKISATGSNASIELIVNGNLELAGIGRMTLIDSGFRIDSAGLVARFQVELDANFGKVLGLKFNASATFALNTTSGDKVFGQSTVKRGFMMEFNGEVEFLGFAKADGNVKLFIGPSESSFEFDVTFNIAEVLQFSAKGGARAVQGQGIALLLNVGISLDMSVITIDADGTLQINTTGSSQVISGVNIKANSFTLDLSGKIEVMKVFGIDAGFKVEVSNDFWSIALNARVDFFGIATLAVSGSLNSAGDVDFRMDGSLSFGSGGFGLFGNFHFHFKNGAYAQDTLGNDLYEFSIGGSARVKAKVFGITLAGLGLSFNFGAKQSAGGDGSAQIILTVKARIKILFVKVTKTAKFNLGTLQFPKPVYLAGSANSPRSWGGSGTLYLNVGDRAGDRNIGVNDTSEAYYVEDLGRYSGGGRIIKVSAFGRSNVINGVSRIIANFGDGNDLVFLGRSVLVVMVAFRVYRQFL